MHYLLSLLIVLQTSVALAALPQDCTQLDPALLEQARSTMQTTVGYGCCQETIADCLAKPDCASVARLAAMVCRMTAQGEDQLAIQTAISNRALSMTPTGKPAKIVIEGYPTIGPEDAPVTLVQYACLTCPYCAEINPPLLEALQQAPYRESVRMIFKPWPIRGHDYAKEGGLAVLAAGDQKHLAAYLSRAYRNQSELDAEALVRWADEVGMDRSAFSKAMQEPATLQALVEAKKEGVALGIDQTPTFFINGRQVLLEAELGTILELLDEELERVK